MTSSPSTPEPAFVGPRRKLMRRGLRHAGLMCGLVILLVIASMAILAPFIAPFDPLEQDLLARLQPPAWHPDGDWIHPLGTDQVGRDYLSRLIWGARVSLTIGIVVALMAGVIGVTLGLLAGYYGGKVDAVITFLITARLSMPVILIALAVSAIMGTSLTVVTVTLGLLLWDRYALVMRATTIQLRSNDFVTAAQLQGASTFQILYQEILPNLLNSLMVVATLEMAQAIILEAALSFLGLGVPAPTPSWGLMISEGKASILFDPWLITIPGIALFLLVLATNLAGDGLRDVTAPQGRN